MPASRNRHITCDVTCSSQSSSSFLPSSSSLSAAAAEAANDNYVKIYNRHNCVAMRRSIAVTCHWIILMVFVGSIDAVLSSSGESSYLIVVTRSSLLDLQYSIE